MRRRASSVACTSGALGYCSDCTVSNAARLSPVVTVLEAALSLQGLIMRQGARKRIDKRQTTVCRPACTHCATVAHTLHRRRASFWGRGHVTVAVTVIALFPTVQHHLSNLCPEEEPLSSFGFAPPPLHPIVTAAPPHQHRTGTVLFVLLVFYCGLAIAPTLGCVQLGGGWAWVRPGCDGWDRECSGPLDSSGVPGNAQRTSNEHRVTDMGQKYLSVVLAPLADSLPRWYLPEELGQGGDAVRERGARGGPKEATSVQPASLPACQPAQQRVPSAQCAVCSVQCAVAAPASAKAIRAFLFLCSRFI